MQGLEHRICVQAGGDFPADDAQCLQRRCRLLERHRQFTMVFRVGPGLIYFLANLQGQCAALRFLTPGFDACGVRGQGVFVGGSKISGRSMGCRDLFQQFGRDVVTPHGSRNRQGLIQIRHGRMGHILAMRGSQFLRQVHVGKDPQDLNLRIGIALLLRQLKGSNGLLLGLSLAPHVKQCAGLTAPGANDQVGFGM